MSFIERSSVWPGMNVRELNNQFFHCKNQNTRGKAYGGFQVISAGNAARGNSYFSGTGSTFARYEASKRRYSHMRGIPRIDIGNPSSNVPIDKRETQQVVKYPVSLSQGVGLSSCLTVPEERRHAKHYMTESNTFLSRPCHDCESVEYAGSSNALSAGRFIDYLRKESS